MQIFLFKEEGKFSISSFITFLFSFQIKKIIIQKLICIFFVNVFKTKFNILVLLVLLIKSVYCTHAYDMSSDDCARNEIENKTTNSGTDPRKIPFLIRDRGQL